MRLTSDRVDVQGDVTGFRDLAPGGEKETVVTVSAAQAPRHGLQQVVVCAVEPAELPVQLPVLDVAHGITCTPREQYGPDFCVSIYSPRYLARYWIMESGGALELLDPQGLRRHDASGLSCPSLIATATRPDGKRQEQRASPRKHPYFNPLVIDGEAGRPDQLYDGGWHVEEVASKPAVRQSGSPGDRALPGRPRGTSHPGGEMTHKGYCPAGTMVSSSAIARLANKPTDATSIAATAANLV